MSGQGASAPRPRGRRVSTPPAGRHRRARRAVITGASSGIGMAVAQELARDHELLLMGRDQQRLEELAGHLREHSSHHVEVLAVDLTDVEAVESAVKARRWKRLDLLVHCAGMEAPGRLEEVTPEQWMQAMGLNVVAASHLTQLFLPDLRGARGLVIFINSGAGLHSWPGHGIYAATKHALKAVADTLREEERGLVRVSTIYPGRVDTPMQRRIQEQAGNTYRPADHASPQSVAAAVRTVAETPIDATIEDLSIRPGGML